MHRKRYGLVWAVAISAIAEPARVVQVFPTADVLPANQLKLYVHFSAPMSRGEAWQRLRLLDESGKAVELPFLEIDQELWDREQKRLTLLFDPGRIKRGVLPREQTGGALDPGRSYELVVDAAWRDADGKPMASEFRKRFRAGEEDRTAIDPAKWKIQTPKSGTRDPLVIDFGEPLDSALALRLIRVDGAGGEAALANFERQWRFTPQEAWRSGGYKLNVDAALEDLAGNKVGRPFDVDTFDPISVRMKSSSTTIPFRIGGH